MKELSRVLPTKVLKLDAIDSASVAHGIAILCAAYRGVSQLYAFVKA